MKEYVRQAALKVRQARARKRQAQVLELLKENLPARQIAQRLSVAPSTIRSDLQVLQQENENLIQSFSEPQRKCTQTKRQRVLELQNKGMRCNEIAKQLGEPVSNVSRWMRLNVLSAIPQDDLGLWIDLLYFCHVPKGSRAAFRYVHRIRYVLQTHLKSKTGYTPRRAAKLLGIGEVRMRRLLSMSKLLRIRLTTETTDCGYLTDFMIRF